jgi:hypothetical protein
MGLWENAESCRVCQPNSRTGLPSYRPFDRRVKTAISNRGERASDSARAAKVAGLAEYRRGRGRGKR